MHHSPPPLHSDPSQSSALNQFPSPDQSRLSRIGTAGKSIWKSLPLSLGLLASSLINNSPTGHDLGKFVFFHNSFSSQPVHAQTSPPLINLTNEAQASYNDPRTSDSSSSSTSNSLNTETPGGELIDPLGRILGCGGEVLTDYGGFSMAIFHPDPSDPTGTELSSLVELTATEFPDLPGNGISGGLSPNFLNVNPFFLSPSGGGSYNFLFDPERGQTAPGSTYILVIRPPEGSIYNERRLRLEIVDNNSGPSGNQVRYLATSLDGQPITASGGTQISETVVLVPDAETVGLDLLSFQLDTVLCQPNQIAITKTADRATAQPGDIILYRLAVRNQSDVALDGLTFTDSLPRGLKLIEDSVQGAIAETEVAVTTEVNGSVATVVTPAILAPQATLNLIYAAQVTPDAVRGSGRNSAVVDGTRTDNDFPVKDGPAVHNLRIRPGITSSYGTLIGRVFHDKNFDGEQQWDEPGLSNAVIFLQDGNRIVTGQDGLFSIGNVQPGYHSGVLDLSSIPGYDFAPNHYRREFNSRSRLVHLEPSGLARMNFPVIPIDQDSAGQDSALDPALEPGDRSARHPSHHLNTTNDVEAALDAVKEAN